MKTRWAITLLLLFCFLFANAKNKHRHKAAAVRKPPAYREVNADYVDAQLYPAVKNTEEARRVHDSLNKAYDLYRDYTHIKDSLSQRYKDDPALAATLLDSCFVVRREKAAKTTERVLRMRRLINLWGNEEEIRANADNAVCERISFTVDCCYQFGLYASKLYATDHSGSLRYYLTNATVAGGKSDVSGIVIQINGHEHRLPLITYNKSEAFFRRIFQPNSVRTVKIKARLLKSYRGVRLFPLLLVDDIEEVYN